MGWLDALSLFPRFVIVVLLLDHINEVRAGRGGAGGSNAAMHVEVDAMSAALAQGIHPVAVGHEAGEGSDADGALSHAEVEALPAAEGK